MTEQPKQESVDQLALANQTIIDMISKQANLDKMMVLMELLKIYDIDMNIAGNIKHVNVQELLTELPNTKYTKEVTKNETWRRTVKEHFKLLSIDHEHIVGTMDKEFMLRMIAHKRQREKAVINGLKNELIGENQQQPTRKKRFFGMV